MFNIEESLGNSFASLLGISSNLSGGNDRQSIKTNLAWSFRGFIALKIIIEGLIKFESSEYLKNPKDPWGLKLGVSYLKLSIGIISVGVGIDLQDQIDKLGDGLIISDISLASALQESILGLVDVIVQIFSLFSPKHQSEAGQLVFDIIDCAFRLWVSIKRCVR